MSSAGRAASSSGCVGRPRGHETGLTDYAEQTQRSLLTGSSAMETAEHREPYESRGSRTDLGAPRGATPLGDSTIPMTQAMVFSADDGCDVGEDSGAPVSQEYGSRGNAFNGTVKGVQLAIGDAAESSDHRVSPEDAIRIAMARQ